MTTPPTGITSPQPSAAEGRRKAPGNPGIGLGASPVLKDKGKEKELVKMQRTPQPQHLTQTKLTGFGITQGPLGSSVPAQAAPEVRAENGSGITNAPTTEPVSMDTAPAPPTSTGGGQVVTTDFLLKSLQENTNQIIKSFTAHLGALSQRVDVNASKIASNSDDISKNRGEIVNHGKEIELLASRVRSLEEAAGSETAHLAMRAALDDEYLRARRSLRQWPITGISEEEMWGAVGEFIHETLRVPETDISQSDISEVTRVLGDTVAGNVREEVIVTLHDKKARDTIMGHAVNLADHVGPDGRPTAGIRLEVPPSLMDPFRLLSRFGTRLRARHGEGTKRHIKFDDFAGSLYANIKLPGDELWTRVTPSMARRDLEASMKEENSFHQRRMASKLVPGPRDGLGPRERLGRPQLLAPPRPRDEERPVVRATAPTPGSSRQVAYSAGPPEGKRPRWTAPERGPPPKRHV